MRARPLVAALATAALLVTAGCGSGTAPAEDVPALATSLDAVDEAVVTGDDVAVRDAVADLTEVTTQAREAGDLDAAAADRILAAAEALLAALEPPAPTEDETSEPPTPEPPTSEPPTPEPTSDDGDDEDEDEDDDEGKGKGKSGDKGKSEDKDEKKED